jgi:hypothetical protein
MPGHASGMHEAFAQVINDKCNGPVYAGTVFFSKEVFVVVPHNPRTKLDPGYLIRPFAQVVNDKCNGLVSAGTIFFERSFFVAPHNPRTKLVLGYLLRPFAQVINDKCNGLVSAGTERSFFFNKVRPDGSS